MFEHKPVPDALPSDVRFREDLIALKVREERRQMGERKSY